MKKIAISGLLLLSLALVATGCNKKVQDKITMDLYAMSQCPYGSQAEDLIYQIKPDFEDYVNFNVEYIASQNPDGSFNSLHGDPEVEGNKYQLCVKYYNPDKFWDFLNCQNKNYQDLKSSFDSCASEVGIDFSKIKACVDDGHANGLLMESLKKAELKQVSASPTFYINNELYQGQRTERGLQRALCEQIDNKADICDELPEEKEFVAHIVIDSRCTAPECDITRLKQQLETTFPKIKYNQLDYDTEDGYKFYTENNLSFLPAVLLEDGVREAEGFSQVEPYLKEVNGMYNLAIGAVHDPTKEICYNQIDDTEDGLVDCDDPECSGFIECRQETVASLDLFVMSQCPYGTQALDAMEAVLDNFGSKIDFNIYYIADENNDGSFRSLHGQPEVDENIRELCAIKYYPNSYMDYIWCRNQDITGSADSCMINYPKINNCFNSDEGSQLLSENIKLAQELGISASPTWLVNNKYKFNGIDAETVRQNICKYNDIVGCENTLSSSSSNVAGVCD